MAFVGQDIPHDSALGHVSGESIFIDDMPAMPNELFCDVVGSPVAHGEIVSIDLEAARNVPGVVRIFTHADVPGHNDIGPVVKDEEVLVEKVAQYVAQPIVLIAAETREALFQAKKLVKITMRELPAIFTIEEAIAKQSFLGSTPQDRARRG
jgi:xanthine dehydrogenase large subunit